MTAQSFAITGTATTTACSPVLFDAVARVRGRLPEWLRGRLVRTAPSLFALDGWHWFDALGMLYQAQLEEHERVTFALRLLQSDVAAAAQRQRAPFGTFATPARRSWWRAPGAADPDADRQRQRPHRAAGGSMRRGDGEPSAAVDGSFARAA
jgi:carotenoid cleavage dioxygenase-like enzyme